MIKAVFEKLPKETGGGYARWDDGVLSVFVDENDNKVRQRLTAIHEVLDAYLTGRVAHPKIEKISLDVADCLNQLNL